MFRNLCLCALIWGFGAGAGQAYCRLALVLGMDVSASVDPDEYTLQARGTAAALLSAPVRQAILGGDPVALSVFVWSGPADQSLVADWVVIDSGATLEELAAQVAGFPRPEAVSGRTATGSAMLYAQAVLDRAPPCDRRVLDLATDGTFNAGPAPEAVRAGPAFRDITINALAVGRGSVPDWRRVKDIDTALMVYLTFRVIHGPGAFVERAQEYADFERAMGRKLLREVQGLVVGEMD
ncbi:MAG: DUF1194 domain-containing protein [Paracoccaceae bacterium]